ncbi:MAG: type I-E CRISPR-associated protein Cse1/CasA [Magnetococcus sp. YQC-5]
MNNLMQDPIIQVCTSTGVIERRTLPGVLAGLMKDEVVSFTALQPHQSHAWHAFLVQLAAIALHRAGLESLPKEETAWRDLLRALTSEWPADEPWQLVVEDLAQPAFMQPPVPEGHLQGFKNEHSQPDQIDVLVTAKNHDIKKARIRHPRPDHWVMALVSLQTMEGFLGAGNYGIARMNGGFASRPSVGIRPGPLLGSHFRWDLAVLQRHRQELPIAYPDFYTKPTGFALLWLLSWEGQTALSLAELDPYFIEICRRMRLVARTDGIVAHGTTSQLARIQAKDFKGVLGDPWTPLRDDTSLTISNKGFDYTLVSHLILGDDHFRQAPAQSANLTTQPGEMELLARALARGQGETGGYHERRIPMPARVRAVLGQPQQRASLAGIAKERVEQCGFVANKVLKPAILTMIQEAPDKLNFKDQRANAWLARLDQKVDDAFFPSLWRVLDQSTEEAENEWLTILREAAETILEAAKKSLIGAGARRYKTFVAADRTFYGAFKKTFPTFSPQTHSSTDEERLNG